MIEDNSFLPALFVKAPPEVRVCTEDDGHR